MILGDDIVMLKVSEFFEGKNTPFVLGAFFSRYIFSDDKKYIYTYGWFRKTQVVETNISYENYFSCYLEKINNESKPYSYWTFYNDLPDKVHISSGLKKSTAHFYVLENDLNLFEDGFYNKLYAKVVTQPWVYDSNMNDSKKSFIRGFMELRGSIDTKANFFTQDYFYNSDFEIKKARVLIDLMGIPYNVINLNFRELQKQFVSGERKRNTQFRPDLLWYMSNIGILNDYKAEIFSKSRNKKPIAIKENAIYFDDVSINRRINNSFENRLSYYVSNVFDRVLTQYDIDRMRNDLGFSYSTNSGRNSVLADLIRNCMPDECVCCKDKYDIADRSYINRITGRYYFEIHHVISLGNNMKLDDENNMVKLCPTCHRTLKRGSGTEQEQKELIKAIFKNAPNTYEFAKHFFNTDDYDEVVKLTYLSLN